VFVFRDGLVARVREYMDTQSGERQIRAGAESAG
jgi:ketosteroid isomerase-like protein